MVFSASRRDINEEEQETELRIWQQAYRAAEDVAALTGARIELRKRASDDTTASLTQYLDDGEWFLTVYEGPTATAALSALHKLYMHLLADDAQWCVTGPDPLDPDVIPTRGLAYGPKRKR